MAYQSNFFGTPQLPESNKFVEITNDSRFPPVSVIKWDYRDSGYSLSSVDIFPKYAVVTYLVNPEDIKVSLSAENINVNLADVENILNVISPDVTAIKNNTDAVETLLTRTNTLVNTLTANNATDTSLRALTAVTYNNLVSGAVTASVSNFSSIASDIGGNAPPIGIQLGFLAGEEDYRHVAPSNPLPVTVSGIVENTDLGKVIYAIPAFYNNQALATHEVSSNTPLPVTGTVNTYPVQGTSVSNSNFTSVTPSTQLVAADAGREVLTVFNEGPGNLHISPGATCTTAAYQVRLAAGDYWECPAGQLSLVHSAVFATAGTARVTQVT